MYVLLSKPLQLSLISPTFLNHCAPLPFIHKATVLLTLAWNAKLIYPWRHIN